MKNVCCTSKKGWLWGKFDCNNNNAMYYNHNTIYKRFFAKILTDILVLGVVALKILNIFLLGIIFYIIFNAFLTTFD